MIENNEIKIISTGIFQSGDPLDVKYMESILEENEKFKTEIEQLKEEKQSIYNLYLEYFRLVKELKEELEQSVKLPEDCCTCKFSFNKEGYEPLCIIDEKLSILDYYNECHPECPLSKQNLSLKIKNGKVYIEIQDERITNAMKIRSMSDEELVDFIKSFNCCNICKKQTEIKCDYSCDEANLAWLKGKAGE